jgi:hypothetical protein
MDQQGSAHWSAYVSAYRDLADLCLWGGLNAVNIFLKREQGDARMRKVRTVLQEPPGRIGGKRRIEGNKDIIYASTHPAATPNMQESRTSAAAQSGDK